MTDTKNTKTVSKVTNPVLGKAERLMTTFASKEEARYVLNGIHWNSDRERWEATDGRRMLIIPGSQVDPDLAEPTEPLKSVIISNDSLKQAQKVAPKAKCHPKLDGNFAIETNGNPQKAKITGKNLDGNGSTITELEAALVEGNFPNCQQVIPADAPRATAVFDAQYLKDLADYAIKCGQTHKDSKTVSIKIKITDELSPMTAEFYLADGRKALHVLMPMRMT